jgi:serine/threonine protein kinase
MVESNYLEDLPKFDPSVLKNIIEVDCEGGQGLIFIGEFNDKKVIIKKFKNSASKNLKELQAYCKLNHEIMVDFYGYFYDENKLNIVLEFAEGEQLDDLVADELLNDKHRFIIIEKMASFLNYLKINHTLHRDLKPQNFIANIIDEEKIVLKVLDFGISKISDNSVISQSTCSGTILYSPPELLTIEPNVNHKYDIWSYGLIISYIYSDEQPWGKINQMQLEFNLLNKKTFPIPQAIKDKNIRKLIEFCTNTNPALRITSKSVLYLIDKIKNNEDISTLELTPDLYN